MVNAGQQNRMKRTVERLFATSCGRPVPEYLKELAALGFTQTGGDPFALQLENKGSDLFLELMLDPGQCIHRYWVGTSAQREARQRKFRW